MQLRNLNFATRMAVVAIVAVGVQANASTLVSDFSNVNLTGTYVQWDGGVFTSGADDFRVEANDFGGGFFVLDSPVDATGETLLEVQLDVNSANVAELFNVVLIDGDGTERVFRFEGVMQGDDQTLTVSLDDFLQDNAAGSTPGLDVANITVFHLQGTFTNGDPGLAMDMTFDNLALTIPEPSTFAGLAIAGLTMALRRRG